MGEYFYDNNNYDDEPPKKKGGTGKRILLILLVIFLVSGLVGGGVYSVTQMVQPEGGWEIPLTDSSDSSEENHMADSESDDADGESQVSGSETTASAEEGTTSAATPGESQIAAAETLPAENALIDGGVTIVDVSDVVEAALPSVVAITNTMIYENYRNYYGYSFSNGDSYEVTGSGSGIILGDNGAELWIVTNEHVVEDTSSLTITFNDGSTADAYVKGTDADNDLAMVGVELSELSAETKAAIRAIELGDSDSLRMGEGVIAIGNALGFGQSVTTGCISALNREVQMSDGGQMTLIQTDAAINPGNSGGALLNREGKLIGINVAKLSDYEVEGMGFAIPISSARDILEELSLIEAPSRRVKVSDEEYPYLGLQLKDISENMVSNYGMPAGILVYYVEEGGPAEAAGILNNDIITAFDGQKVTNYEDLYQLLPYYAGGTVVTITVMRMDGGEYLPQEFSVILGFRTEHQS